MSPSTPYEQLDAWVDQHFEEQVRLLQELVRVPTDTPPGNNAPHAERTAAWASVTRDDQDRFTGAVTLKPFKHTSIDVSYEQGRRYNSLSVTGNAIDAAVAVGYAEAVTNPCCGNIGGGGFMLIRLADGRTLALDYRETAPARASRLMFVGADGNPKGTGSGTIISRDGWIVTAGHVSQHPGTAARVLPRACGRSPAAPPCPPRCPPPR